MYRCCFHLYKPPPLCSWWNTVQVLSFLNLCLLGCSPKKPQISKLLISIRSALMKFWLTWLFSIFQKNLKEIMHILVRWLNWPCFLPPIWNYVNSVKKYQLSSSDLKFRIAILYLWFIRHVNSSSPLCFCSFWFIQL